MSIKKIIEENFKIHYAITGGGTYSMYYECLEKATQQIITEIVQELEKMPISLLKIKEDKQGNECYQHVLGLSEVIETIKKMRGV